MSLLGQSLTWSWPPPDTHSCMPDHKFSTPTGSLYLAKMLGPTTETNADIPFNMVGIVMNGTKVFLLDGKTCKKKTLNDLMQDERILAHVIRPLKPIEDSRRDEVIEHIIEEFIETKQDKCRHVSSCFRVLCRGDKKDRMTPAELTGRILYRSGVLWTGENHPVRYSDATLFKPESSGIPVVTPGMNRRDAAPPMEMDQPFLTSPDDVLVRRLDDDPIGMRRLSPVDFAIAKDNVRSFPFAIDPSIEHLIQQLHNLPETPRPVLNLSWFHDAFIQLPSSGRLQPVRAVDELTEMIRRASPAPKRLPFVNTCRQVSELAAELHVIAKMSNAIVCSSFRYRRRKAISFDESGNQLSHVKPRMNVDIGNCVIVLPKYMWGGGWEYNWQSQFDGGIKRITELCVEMKRALEHIPEQCVLFNIITHLSRQAVRLHDHASGIHCS